jgi:hypothetical protein
VASDFNPCRSHTEDLEDEELKVIYETDHFTEVKKLKMGRLYDVLLLHHAALTLTDEELNTFFMTHADDEIGWDQVTNSEATLLHLTAYKLKPLSTQWLLKNIRHANSWKTAHNINRYTPLKALQETLETMQTQKEYSIFRVLNLSDHFKGYPNTIVSYLSLLLGQDSLGLSKACLQYRCTCRECVEGLLST